MPSFCIKPKPKLNVNMAYQVTLSNSGTRFLVNDDEYVLDAAIRQGIGMPYGCRNGLCSGCKGKITSGQVRYEGQPDALTEQEKEHGLALFCQAYAQSDLTIVINELTHSAQVPLKRFPAKVTHIARLNHDVMQIILTLPPSIRMQFFAGQYIDFILDDERRRSFSIANAPHEDRHIELHIRHIDGGAFTGEVFDGMQLKDIVRIEGPLGSFFLREESQRPVILMAGGTGFAPIKGIVEHALNKQITRDFYIYWGARSAADLYMHEQVQAWAKQHAQIRYVPVLSEPDADWQGETGFVHEAVLRDFTTLADFEVYASGPPAMVYAGRDAFVERGMDPEYYYSDAFEFAND